jgi:hypothetical protein
MEPDPPGNSQYRRPIGMGSGLCRCRDRRLVSVLLRVSEGRWSREGEAMCQRSMWKAVRVTPSDIHPSRIWTSRLDIESRSDRGPRSSSDRESKIVIVSGYAERLLVAQPMSTGPSGDCETPFFPDDSDVSATEPRQISPFRALSGSTGRGVDLETGWDVY